MDTFDTPEPAAGSSDTLERFIARWQPSGGAERANAQLFLTELCDLLGLPRPDPARPENALNTYTFERAVTETKPDGSKTTAYIDLYRAGCFVLETKQGVNAPAATDPSPAHRKTGHGTRGNPGWDTALDRAYNQALRYIRCLPPSEGRPPFLIVCDAGHHLELYSEFTRSGGVYVRFPDPRSHRIRLEDLRRPEIRDLLRAVWLDPLSLDPARHAAAVTRDIAGRLARLARSMEESGHDPAATALFLQRCLFTMFAEDIGLLPPDSFRSLLAKCRGHPAGFPVFLTTLWKDMAAGAPFSTALLAPVAHFNGGLFDDPSAPALSPDQIAMLLDAAQADWSAVEPAIFGTLLERALDPRERHKLGAHYTPRAYVERLVKPVLTDPLRAEWENIKTAAAASHQAGETPAALEQIRAFHRRLCALRVLDPACGSGNFLYVALEHLKRLEAEVLDLLAALGDPQLTLEISGFKVRPEQFLGIELNPRAAAIAQLVLWIGYFQWHKRATGRADTNDRPLLPKSPSIQCRDALLDYDAKTLRADPATGRPLTIWDGRTTKTHPVTGKEIPDDTARAPVFGYTNPRPAAWPAADFIIGNPPFLGASRMRDTLGPGYTEALRAAYKNTLPESADLVMFWWRKAADLTASRACQRFGFITTNSIHQTLNRRVLEPFLTGPTPPLHLAFAIPDHPWVDSADGAAVRIAMTAAAPGPGPGSLHKVTSESPLPDGESHVTLSAQHGLISPSLTIGAPVAQAQPLQANLGLSCPGVKLHGAGFIITPEQAAAFVKEYGDPVLRHIRGYRNGKDITATPRGVLVIDLLGLSEHEVREKFPAIYQHVYSHVKPERDQNNRDAYRLNWWIFGEPRREFRPALAGLPRYIATVETSKHRFFLFLDRDILPDNMLVAIASDDPALLAILSSTLHVRWALAAGGRLGLGNDPRYNKTRCFETFPFPDLPDGPLKDRLRALGEQLDAHRKTRQTLHPGLTLTGMYNVLAKLRAGEPLDDAERAIHDQGLVTLLKQIHDDIDAAVLEAYRWADLADPCKPLADRLAAATPEAEALEQELLTRLVTLNRQRAAEEAGGHIRWLRPAFQGPASAPATTSLGLRDTPADPSRPPGGTPAAAPAARQPWPKTLPDRVALIRTLLATEPPDPRRLAARLAGARKEDIAQILHTLRLLGHL